MPNDDDLLDDLKNLTNQMIKAAQYCLDEDFVNIDIFNKLEITFTASPSG